MAGERDLVYLIDINSLKSTTTETEADVLIYDNYRTDKSYLYFLDCLKLK